MVQAFHEMFTGLAQLHVMVAAAASFCAHFPLPFVAPKHHCQFPWNSDHADQFAGNGLDQLAQNETQVLGGMEGKTMPN